MSVTRHHAEWLSLIEISGPFLSMPVLMRVFPQGLDPREPEKARELRLAYEERLEKPNEPGRHHAWVRYVLARFLEFTENMVLERQSIPYGIEARIAEYGEMLRPDYAVVAPPGHVAAGKPHLLLQVYPTGQNLDGPVSGKHWKASPATRMTELLHAVDIPLGMITNGEQWMLVFAPRGETTGFASWDAGIWQEEPITLRAFSSLMHARRFFGVAESDTLLSLLKESAKDQQEVTDQLGLQVRRAVEVLVQAFDRLDQDSGRQLLSGIVPKELYDAALTIMMKLVFLFSAEEREMLRLGEPLYNENYAASTLSEQLREAADQHGEEVLERRSDAWSRLLATFRAVYGGIVHETLRLPAYGGTLFDPDRYPFLEGRPAGTDWKRTLAKPLAVNNRVVLHLLESLQLLQMKVPGGGPAEARRLSFRALDIEQIGHVYEGLLDHTAVRTDTIILGLQGTKTQEPEIPLDKLEKIRVEGEYPLIEYLKEETKRSEAALRRALAVADENNEHELLIACGQDARQCDRIRPFAGLLRTDSFGMPVVILPGSIYVTEGTTRRSTGTHYTPKTLTEPIVQHTLEPLVYEGPAEGRPKENWKLRSPREILALRVCDMTMGSGAFLVQSCRYLAERLAEAWENMEQASPGSFVVTPEGELSTGNPAERLLPKDPDERIVIARRAIADRCLYGVDINPMAVEMAKLSLWLVTMQKDRPFTFLDHALKCGDSLVGITSLEQLENFSLRPCGVKQLGFATLNLWQHVEEAKKKREELEAMPSDTPEQIATKAVLFAEAEKEVAMLSAAADVLVAVEIKNLAGEAYNRDRDAIADQMMSSWVRGLDALNAFAAKLLGKRQTFHWALAYPEIVSAGGFSVFIGNPPFLGGKQISSTFSASYWDFCRRTFQGVSGNMNYVGLFLRRAVMLMKSPMATAGFIAAKGIAEGDTREGTLVPLLEAGHVIYWAETAFPWPGTAEVFVSAICLSNGHYASATLNGETVPRISSRLEAEDEFQPYALKVTAPINFNGMKLGGEGFILDFDTPGCPSIELPVVKKFLRSSAVFSATAVTTATYVVDFESMSEAAAKGFPTAYDWLVKRVKEYRLASNRPSWKKYWWRHAEVRTGLRRAMEGKEAVLVIGGIASYHRVQRCPIGLFDHNLIIVPNDSFEIFAVLQSNIHEVWASKLSSSLTEGGGYRPSDCLDTYPLPKRFSSLAQAGEEFWDTREQLLQAEGSLNAVYAKYHNTDCNDGNIFKLRSLMTILDQCVVAAYGWQDLDLDHSFHETKQGVRFTICESARRIVLDRLLALNHERHEEEIKAGLHDKKAVKSASKGRTKKAPPEKKKDQYEIFEE